MRFRPRHFFIAVTLAVAPALAQTAPQTAAPVARMAADAHPSFAVAAIKPHDPTSTRQGFNTTGDRFTIRNETVSNLIAFAYAIHRGQIVNAPDGLAKDAYDIVGTCDTEGEPNLRQFQEIVQKLLGDRFQLHFHREKRDLSAYALRLAKGGPKLTPAADPTAQPDQEGNSHGAELIQTYTNADMANFILGMQFFTDRPIVDQTGLTGSYDFKLSYTYDETRTTDPDAPPGIFTAIQEQLGLKLVPVKAPVDVFVIDHVEHPSAN